MIIRGVRQTKAALKLIEIKLEAATPQAVEQGGQVVGPVR